MIKARTREELYDLFRQGAIPSGADFADFIKSQLNLLDEGFTVSENADDPIGFRAHGKAANYLDLADQDGDKRWRVSGFDGAVRTEGLNIGADEQSKLFIERDTGNVGINTDGPQAKLHIIQTNGSDAALRIDDAGNDNTPLVVTSEGQVGVGTASPGAKLHLSYSGNGDILRVDDTESDTTPLIIDETGNLGVGYSNPQAKLTVAGGMSVGANQNPGNNNLYVAGKIEVEGTVVISGGDGVGGIEINAPLTSKTKDIILKDNLIVTGDSSQAGSDGNLIVAGDTTLGTYQVVYENQNVLTVNGRIRSGADLNSGAEQYELELNDFFTLDRTPGNPLATVAGNFTVTGNTALGDTRTDGIYLNGAVQTDVLMNQNLEVVKTATIDGELRVNGETKFQKYVRAENDLEIKGALIGGLPIGTILMYDGQAWQDDVTIPGWYAMIAANVQYGCHDMTDRFVMGKNSPGSGQLGGENVHTLTIAELPTHYHSITHNHGNTGYNNANHQHGYDRFYGNREDWKSDSWGGGAVGWNVGAATGYADSGHYHAVPSYIGNSGTNGGGVAHENRPQYYSVLYIRRCK